MKIRFYECCVFQVQIFLLIHPVYRDTHMLIGIPVAQHICDGQNDFWLLPFLPLDFHGVWTVEPPVLPIEGLLLLFRTIPTPLISLKETLLCLRTFTGPDQL